MPLIIVSGGQTGVDRAGLDVAIRLGLEHRGWCPRHRKAEDGVIGPKYNLQETSSEHYEQRTLFNIRDSDATLIVVPEECDVQSISDGTKLTIDHLIAVGKPYLVVSVGDNEELEKDSLDKCRQWLSSVSPKVLNIAGPRESTAPGVYHKAQRFLNDLLA